MTEQIQQSMKSKNSKARKTMNDEKKQLVLARCTSGSLRFPSPWVQDGYHWASLDGLMICRIKTDLPDSESLYADATKIADWDASLSYRVSLDRFEAEISKNGAFPKCECCDGEGAITCECCGGNLNCKRCGGSGVDLGGDLEPDDSYPNKIGHMCFNAGMLRHAAFVIRNYGATEFDYDLQGNRLMIEFDGIRLLYAPTTNGSGDDFHTMNLAINF